MYLRSISDCSLCSLAEVESCAWPLALRTAQKAPRELAEGSQPTALGQGQPWLVESKTAVEHR
jgi:hypothetical protein